MMNYRLATLFVGVVGLLCFVIFSKRSSAQPSGFYQINKTNALPSDNVYCFLQDRLGYLWIATDKGVVKYNGYTKKVFNRATGLVSDDVWAMIDDNSGRVWLGGASGQFGYVYNDRYRHAIRHNFSGTIFPYYLHRFDSGIIFNSPYLNGLALFSICISRHDTIFPCTLTERILTNGADTTLRNDILSFINSKGESYAVSDNCYRVTNLKTIADTPSKLIINKISNSRLFNKFIFNNGRRGILLGHTYIFYTPGLANYVLLLDANTNKPDTLNLSDYGENSLVEYVAYSIDRAYENKLFVYTATKCMVFNFETKPELEYSFDCTQLTGTDKERKKVIQFLSLSLWDTVVGTNTHGIFLKRKGFVNHFVKNTSLSLSGFSCVGVVYDSISFWWHPQKTTLLQICNRKIINTYNLKGYSVNNISEFGRDTLLQVGGYNHFITQGRQKFHEIFIGLFGGAVKKVVEYKPNCYYVLSAKGAFCLKPDYNVVETNRQYIALDRFKDATFDKYHQKMIAYHDYRLLVFDENSQQTFSATQINKTSDELIEKVCADATYGNIFIKSGSSLYYFDYPSGKTELIPSNWAYRNGTIDVWKNYLVIMGDFGVSFQKIEGKGKLSAPVVYMNLKKDVYKEIQSYAIVSGKLLMQTDAGLYTVLFPPVSAFNNHSVPIPYHIILQDQDQRILNNNDTVRLANNTKIFYADVINPLGNGALRIYYRFGTDKKWIQCNGNEIIVPDYITPDDCYRFEVYCEDDGWRSPVTTAAVWVTPTIWQKHSTRYLLGLGAVILILIVVVVSVVITRRLVNRAQQKKQMQMELELKAIYAQINPHFIFNALTSAMLLIKKNRTEEAYTHVAKFSRLLRSYLNSSRNKYITIADEIANLTNYMELQQTRFKDRFESIISVEDTLDPNNLIPSLLIQPFVENAINHGVLPADWTGRLEVIFRKTPDGVQCVVSDNGIGRQASKLMHKDRDPTHNSYGDMLIKDLVKVFNTYEEMKIDIRYSDRNWPDSGTDVIIDICYLR